MKDHKSNSKIQMILNFNK